MKTKWAGLLQGQRELGALDFLACGFASGLATRVASNPLFVIKTRMQLQETRVYNSMYHALRTIVRTEGLGGLYKGLLPSLLETSQGALQFMFFEEIPLAKRSMYG